MTEKTFIFMYCFETGPDIDDPRAKGKKRHDNPGRRVIKTEWRPDSKVFCERCKKLLLFNGSSFFDNLTGELHFWIDEDSSNLNSQIIPRGHMLRYDIKGINYRSPRYCPPKDRKQIIFDFRKEFEITKQETEKGSQ